MSFINNKSVKEKLSLGYLTLRSFHFTLQGTLLPWANFMATGEIGQSSIDRVKHFKTIMPKIQKLFFQDAKNIAEGVYPLDVLQPENPLEHNLRLPFLFYDSFKAARRRSQNSSTDFDKKLSDQLDELPAYYRRNFHFQTNGYLSEQSAGLYEHQVEVLFAGTADPMRRLLIPLVKEKLQNSKGEGLRFLEVGCGTGRLSNFMAMAFPKAQITCVDLSSFYLKEAQQRLSQVHRVDYLQGKGEDLPIQSETFDLVFSCFLFHELPKEIRIQMILEAKRLLKPNGLLGIVDSIQLNDDPDLNWALEQFPKNFHEPFFKDYISNSLEEMLDSAGFNSLKINQGFLSKALIVNVSK